MNTRKWYATAHGAAGLRHDDGGLGEVACRSGRSASRPGRRLAVGVDV